MAETKHSIVGIAIPEKCGKVDMNELTGIRYHDDLSDNADVEYQVFITKKILKSPHLSSLLKPI